MTGSHTYQQPSTLRGEAHRIAGTLVEITCDSHIAATTRRVPTAGGTGAGRRDDLRRYVRGALDAGSAPDPEFVAAILIGQTPPAVQRRRRQALDIA